MNNGFTPTEQRIMRVLGDMMEHTYEEIRQCLFDDMGERGNVYFHITQLRAKLRPKGQDILNRRDVGYRWVRLLPLNE